MKRLVVTHPVPARRPPRNIWPASFEGRIGRKQYWIRTLSFTFGGLLGFALLIVLCILNYNPPNDTITARTIVDFVLFGITIVVFVFMVVGGLGSTGVRRLHDRGKSGGWLFLYYFVPQELLFDTSLWHGARMILPFAAIAVCIWGLIDLGMLRGEAPANVFGPDPLRS